MQPQSGNPSICSKEKKTQTCPPQNETQQQYEVRAMYKLTDTQKQRSPIAGWSTTVRSEESLNPPLRILSPSQVETLTAFSNIWKLM